MTAGRAHQVAALVACLRGHGLQCSLGVTRTLGETDIRLVITTADGDTHVELLGLCPCSDGVDAVRVRAGQRQVWRAHGRLSATAIAEFVDDLCRRDAFVLEDSYALLG